MKHFSLFLFAIVFSLSSNAQVQTVSNQKSIGDLGLLAQSSCTKLSDGSFILTSGTMSGISGDKSSPSFGEFDIWVVRIDANYNILWQKSFGGIGQDISMMCKQTNQGDILIAGTSNSPVSGNKTVGTNGDNDFWIIKIDLNGNIIWQKNFGGIDSEKLFEIEIINDSLYALLGSSMSGISGDKSQELRGSIDNWVVMIDSSGQKIWDKTIGGSDLDEPVCILYNNLDNTIIVGSNSESNISGDKTENSQGDTDIWILQLSLQGGFIHQKTIGGNNYDRIESIVIDENNNFYLNCTSASPISGDKTESSLGGYDFWILKLNADFEITWNKTFGGTGEDVSSKMIKTQNQQLVAFGSSNSLISEFKSENSKGEEDVWIISIDTLGSLNWDKTIGGFQSDNGFNVIEKAPNNFAVFSYSSSGISGDKTAPNRGMYHFWMFDLTTTLGIDALEQTNFTVYPNPAHNWIHVPFVENKPTVFTLTDASGRIVDSGVLTATQLDVSTFQNGMYTLQLLTDDQVLVSRFVVQK